MPMGIPARLVPATAPRRPDLTIEPTGNPAYDRVGAAIALARVWFRSLSVAYTAADLVEAADLMLRVENGIEPPAPATSRRRDVLSDKPSSPAPVNHARRASPPAKKEAQ